MAERVPVHLRYRSTQSVEGFYECFVKKTLQLQSLITEQKSKLNLLKPRFRTRLFHLRGNLLSMKELDPSASDITTSKYIVRDLLDSIEINLDKMDVTHLPGQE